MRTSVSIPAQGLTMSVAALSKAGFSQYISASGNLSASQQAFKSLQQSLASGNLAAAQTAFNTYNPLDQSLTTSSSSSSSSTSSNAQLSKDMAALGTAIGSGDLNTAQSAFATVQGDLKSAPSQAVANAETAVAQTVQWVDDLLGGRSVQSLQFKQFHFHSRRPAHRHSRQRLRGEHIAPSADPTTSILDSAYGTGATGSSSAVATNASNAVSSGNAGSGASVNVYA